MTRLIKIWNENQKPLSEISLKILHAGTAYTKAKQKINLKVHTEYLDKRMNLWESGNFDEVMQETRAIQ